MSLPLYVVPLTLVAYIDDILEADRDYSLNITGRSPQYCSSRIVELNYQRNQLVEESVEAWKEYCQKKPMHSSSSIFTTCEEYYVLRGLGLSIIAHLMVELYHDGHGYWYELLHEIIHGRKMGAHVYQRPVFYDEFCRWFNEGAHGQAPEYIRTPMDRRISGD